ncbi:MAG: hypothetical protein N4A76_02805 [Firmicutes bacterium]|jgi:major membrane immunogen (membrane-anchored lipoprotein)|nr:hypothetical protein [Bacillota bacterium]
MNKILKLALFSTVLVVALAGCTSTSNTIEKTNETKSTEISEEKTKESSLEKVDSIDINKDGTYTSSSKGYEDFGEVQLKDIVTVEVLEGKIASVDWNQEIKGGGDRKAISKASQDMVERGGAQAPWFEQANLVTTYVVETQDLNAPDAISGVTIDIVDFYDLLNTALLEAK